MIRLLETQRIAADGITVRWHKAGEIIDLPSPLADALIRDGLAEDADTPPVAHEPKSLAKHGKKQEYRRS